MTKTIEKRQREIELAEAKYKQRLYQGGLSTIRIFPKFSLDTK